MLKKINNTLKFFYLSIEPNKKKNLKILVILMTIASFLEFLSIGGNALSITSYFANL